MRERETRQEPSRAVQDQMMMSDNAVEAMAATYRLPERMTSDDFKIFQLYLARYQMYQRPAIVSLFQQRADLFRMIPILGDRLSNAIVETQKAVRQTAKEYERQAKELYDELKENHESTLRLSRSELQTRASMFVLEHAAESKSPKVRSSRAEAYLDKFFGKVDL